MNDDKLKQDHIELDGEAGTDIDEVAPVKNSSDYLVNVLMFLVLGFIPLMLLSPWLYGWVNALGREGNGEYIGMVQTISYVGGLGPDTQVNTDVRTVLLRGAVILKKGDRLELRKGYLGSDVCLAGTDRCWRLMGN